jgi:hypothetical protein
MPAEEFWGLIADLRDFWVLKREKIRLTTANTSGYWRWQGPIKALNAERNWPREYALCGSGPDCSSLLTYSKLQEIDRLLRLSSPSARRGESLCADIPYPWYEEPEEVCLLFDGFDYLCESLHLPAKRSNLTSSFQISAELPARIERVFFDWSTRDLGVDMHGYGRPDLFVDWWPERTLGQPVIGWHSTIQSSRQTATVRFEESSQSARVILRYGGLEADVARTGSLYFATSDDPPIEQYHEIKFVREEPPVPDLAISKAANQQKLSKISVADLLSKYRSPLTWAIASKTLSIPQVTYRKVCNALDKDTKLELPPKWKKFLAGDLFVQVLTDKSRKHVLEKEIDKVWAHMRQWGYPPDRPTRSLLPPDSPVTLHSK